MITVATNGGKKEIDFKEDMSLKDVLNEAGIKPEKKATITVNGEETKDNIELKDEDQIVIAPPVGNG